MLSPEEQALLYWMARDYADPDVGAIVDAGSFLGGSSAALLAGLRDRPRPWTGPPLHSYDLFLVEDYTRDAYFSGTGLTIGDSFRHLYDRYVDGYDVPHEVHEGDIIALGWGGGPIHVLFLDVLKAWSIEQAVRTSFMPHLVPGRSLIAHQDYGYGICVWIHLGVELMWNHLEHIAWMPHGTHLFRLTEAVPHAVLSVDLLRDLTADQQFELMDRAIARWDGETRGMLELAKVSLVALHFGRDAALRHTEYARQLYLDEPNVQGCADRTEAQVRAM